VLLNLVGNANRHTKNGTIDITIRQTEQSKALFIVEDNGEGISPESLDKIFLRGFSGAGGTGIGLSICKETVEAHGGSIELASTPRSGTRISFTLPLYREDAEQ